MSQASGISSATIKFYLREGLLPPGHKRNATLADYDENHLARLNLISALREVVAAPLQRIRELIELIDDPKVPLEEVMQEAQLIGLGEVRTDDEAGPASRAKVADLIRSKGWPDSPSEARRALARHLEEMEAFGLVTPRPLMEAYAKAASIAADAEIGLTPPDDRNRAAMMVAVGVHSYTGLLMRLVALAQASGVIGRRSVATGSDGR